jgi:predicted RNA binding protein YcfA (HicA-like mRNA interferase family)
MTGSRASKTLDAMRANPRDWRIADLERVAAAFGINLRKPGGSHVYFTHPAVPEGVSVPAHRPIKPVYVRAFVRLVDRVRQA